MQGEGAERGERSNCFRLIYPVSYTHEDATTITGESQFEIKASIKAFK